MEIENNTNFLELVKLDDELNKYKADQPENIS